jgi:hypothetical protein
VGAEAKESPGIKLRPAEVNRLVPRNFRREKELELIRFMGLSELHFKLNKLPEMIRLLKFPRTNLINEEKIEIKGSVF